MAYIVSTFFGIIGVSQYPPENVAELIPYLLTVTVGVVLVSATFKVIAHIVGAIFDFGRM